MAEILWAVGVAVLLVIGCLVVREQTEKWIRGLALEVRALRNRDKRLSENRTDVDKIAYQLREVSLRADRREYELEEVSDRFEKSLRVLHLAIREEEMPAWKARRKDASDQEQAETDEPSPDPV